MDINKLSRRLLDSGYTREQTPPGCESWNDFYGGWTYNREHNRNAVYQTPCGLTGRIETIGSMSYMGVEYTLENDNYTIRCPMECRNCDQKDPALKESNFFECSVHEITPPDGWQDTISLMREAKSVMNERLIADYIARHHGRVCPHVVRINDGIVVAGYDANVCADMRCPVCDMTGEPMDRQKGNVYYDLCEETRVGNDDLLGYSTQITKQKGVKYFDHPVSMTIARRAAKNKAEVESRARHKRRISQNEFWRDHHGIPYRWWVENIRAEARETRDLVQDLEDVKNGVAVIHLSDTEKAEKETKKKQRQERKMKSIRKIARKIADGSSEKIDEFRLERYLRIDEDAMMQALSEEQERADKQAEKAEEQLTMF